MQVVVSAREPNVQLTETGDAAVVQRPAPSLWRLGVGESGLLYGYGVSTGITERLTWSDLPQAVRDGIVSACGDGQLTMSPQPVAAGFGLGFAGVLTTENTDFLVRVEPETHFGPFVALRRDGRVRRLLAESLPCEAVLASQEIRVKGRRWHFVVEEVSTADATHTPALAVHVANVAAMHSEIASAPCDFLVATSRSYSREFAVRGRALSWVGELASSTSLVPAQLKAVLRRHGTDLARLHEQAWRLLPDDTLTLTGCRPDRIIHAPNFATRVTDCSSLMVGPSWAGWLSYLSWLHGEGVDVNSWAQREVGFDAPLADQVDVYLATEAVRRVAALFGPAPSGYGKLWRAHQSNAAFAALDWLGQRRDWTMHS